MVARQRQVHSCVHRDFGGPSPSEAGRFWNLGSVHKYLGGGLEKLGGVKKVLKLQKRGVKNVSTSPQKKGGVKKV